MAGQAGLPPVERLAPSPAQSLEILSYRPRRARKAAPEAFEANRIANLIGGEWKFVGETRPHALAIDASLIPGPPRIDKQTAVAAVEASARQHVAWSKVPLDERQRRVQAALGLLREHRDTLALLLMWEIGKNLAASQKEFD